MPSFDTIWSFASGRDRQRTITKILSPLFFFCLAVFGVLFYFVLSPLAVDVLLPQYPIAKNYTSLQMCADSSVQDSSLNVFQPRDCSAIDNTKILGCVFDGKFDYKAPSNATSEQSIVCPTLKPQDNNSSVPVFRVNRKEYEMTVAVTTTLLVGAIYVAIRLILPRPKTQAPIVE